MTRLTILVAICLISMCHEVQASSLMANSSNSKAISTLSNKLNSNKSSIKSNNKSNRSKVSDGKKNDVSGTSETVVLNSDQMAEVEEVKKFLEENAPIFDLNGNCYYDMVSLPKGTYIRSGKEFKVE